MCKVIQLQPTSNGIQQQTQFDISNFNTIWMTAVENETIFQFMQHHLIEHTIERITYILVVDTELH